MEEKKDWKEELQDIINREMFKEDLMIQIKSLVEQELDRAREEGRREALEQIQRFVEDEMLVITRDGTDILEKYIKEWLSKLTTK